MKQQELLENFKSFHYIIEIYNERENAMQDIIDTQDWLDTYGR